MKSFKAEDKRERQKYYGFYCNICRNKNLEIKPYYDFTLDDYFEVKSIK